MSEHNEHGDITQLPKWLLAPFRIGLRRLRDESHFVHLTMAGLQMHTLRPEIITLLSETADSDDNEDTTDVPQRLEVAQRDADWVGEETKGGFPRLHSHSVVAFWSVLEVFVEDVSAAWLHNRPDAWQCDALQQLSGSLGTFRSLDAEAQTRFVITELRRTTNAALRSGKSALDATLRPFELAPPVGPNVRKALHELGQVRNVVVHSGGVADVQFVEACPWFNLSPGDKMPLAHSIWGWYLHAAERYCERVLNQAMIRLGGVGCNCEGMDEISDRPQPSNWSPRPKNPNE